MPEMVIVSPILAASGWMDVTHGSPALPGPAATTGRSSRLTNSSPRLEPLAVTTCTSPEPASSGIVTLMRVSVHSE
jgi:hypothetical protein